jgi:hypothetical protein
MKGCVSVKKLTQGTLCDPQCIGYRLLGKLVGSPSLGLHDPLPGHEGDLEPPGVELLLPR